MMKGNLWGRAVVFSALALVLTIPALGQGGSWITVMRRQGVVESRLASSNTWMRVLTNRRLGTQDWAQTQSDGVAHLRLADNSLMAMGPATRVQMQRFVLDSRRRDAAVTLPAGSLRTQVSGFRGRDSRFEVSTPNAVLAAQGTDFLVTVLNPDELSSEDGWVQAQGGGQVVTRLAVFHGTVLMTGQRGRSITVHAGGTAELVGEGLPQASPPAFSFEQAGVFVRREPGLDLPDPMRSGNPHLAPFDPGTRGTVFNNFGSGQTGLTADSKSTSTGRQEEGTTGGTPVLINPRSESTGTLIIDLGPSSYPSMP